jgi:hypothetical protein
LNGGDLDHVDAWIVSVTMCQWTILMDDLGPVIRSSRMASGARSCRCGLMGTRRVVTFSPG